SITLLDTFALVDTRRFLAMRSSAARASCIRGVMAWLIIWRPIRKSTEDISVTLNRWISALKDSARNAAQEMAFFEISEKSRGTNILAILRCDARAPVLPRRAGTVRTEHGAWRTTRSVVLPRRTRSNPV